MEEDTNSYERVPPQHIEAEKAVIGSMMLSKDAVDIVAEILSPEDFYQARHETIFRVITDLSNDGIPADLVTVSDALERADQLTRVGGKAYLVSLVGSVATTANAGHYAGIVRNRAQLRNLVDAGTRIVQLGYSEGADVDEIVDRAQAEIYKVAERRTGVDYVNLNDLAEPLLEELDRISEQQGGASGVPTGLRDLDSLTTGLQPGQMIIVAARPGMGKSTLGLNFLAAAAIDHQITSVIFSLEMSRMEIGMRLLSAQSGVAFSKMRKGQLTPQDWNKVSHTISNITNAPLFIDDSPNITMTEIRSKCRRLKQQHNLGLVVVDYLQLMSSHKTVESRQQEVSEFSRSMKLLAKELELPVVAVAQLNRGPEQRTDKKPMMADLRESGSLEQDADVIMLLHRPDYYEEDQRPGEADIIVAKHRNGETRTIAAAFQGHLARFADLARE
ncbi:MAG: replicative DNA helicase [Actinomycetaceae bacterium]|nr:replicative DNA helicase [Actinomycetaceae bacterium]